MYETYTTNGFGIIQDLLQQLWDKVAAFIPNIVVAFLVLVIGLIVAVLAGKLAWHLIKILQLDRALDSLGFKRVWERTGYKLNTPYFFYELVKWFFVVLTLMVITEVLHLEQVTEFLQTVVLYLPNVFIAAAILIIGVLVARFVEGLVRGSVKATQLASANFLGSVAKWAILIFSLIIALERLNVAKGVIDTAVEGITFAVALAIGLAFGLGGRDHADEFLTRMRKHISN